MSEEPNGLWDLLWGQVESQPDEPCLTAFEQGTWQRWTWGQIAALALSWADQLRDFGVRQGARVVLWSENRWEWIVADLAILAAGGVSVPLHASLTIPQVHDLATHCGARHLLLAHPETARELSRLEHGSGPPPQYLTFASGGPYLEPAVHQLSTFAPSERSAVPAATDLGQIPRADWDALTTILYTSGTTGKPKGVMLSQGNLLANVSSKLAVLPLSRDDSRLCFLPLSHIFARTCDVYTWLAAGCQLALARSPAHVFEDLQAIRPTYLNGVPYFYEKCLRRAAEQNALQRPGWLRDALGGRIRLCNCGGAPLPDYVQQWFDSQQVTLVTGYGLTEASPVLTSSAPGHMKMGAVGRKVPGVELKLAADGEIMARGENIMLGYYRDPEATAETLRDGWLATGDTGVFDSAGFLTLTGRKKELIITSGGKNIDPVALEHRLLAQREISQCLVVGDRRDFLIALVLPEQDAGAPAADELDRWRRLAATALSDLSHYEQVGHVLVIEEPFTVVNGLLTVKGSLRRQEIERHYRQQIDAAYAAAQRRRQSSTSFN